MELIVDKIQPDRDKVRSLEYVPLTVLFNNTCKARNLNTICLTTTNVFILLRCITH